MGACQERLKKCVGQPFVAVVMEVGEIKEKKFTDERAAENP